MYHLHSRRKVLTVGEGEVEKRSVLLATQTPTAQIIHTIHLNLTNCVRKYNLRKYNCMSDNSAVWGDTFFKCISQLRISWLLMSLSSGHFPEGCNFSLVFSLLETCSPSVLKTHWQWLSALIIPFYEKKYKEIEYHTTMIFSIL